MRILLVAVLLSLLAGCAQGLSTLGPPPEPGQIVTGFTQELVDRPGYEVYLRNNVEYPVTITSLSIFECRNIAIRCDTREMAVVLAPGEVRRVAVSADLQPGVQGELLHEKAVEDVVGASPDTTLSFMALLSSVGGS